MKKLFTVACVLCALLLCSAWADQTISTDHFEMDLPGHWLDLSPLYINDDHAVLDFEEFPFADYSEAFMDTNAEFVVTMFKEGFIKNTSDYGGNLRSEPMEVAGKPSALITYTTKAGNTQYAAFAWTDEVIGFMVYADLYTTTPKENFIALASTMRRKGDAPAATQPPSGRAVEIPNGEWIVGKGIPVGDYSVRYAGVRGGGMAFQVWRSAVGDYSNNGLIYNELVTADSPLGRISLNSGYIVVIKNGPALFGYPIKPGF